MKEERKILLLKGYTMKMRKERKEKKNWNHLRKTKVIDYIANICCEIIRENCVNRLMVAVWFEMQTSCTIINIGWTNRTTDQCSNRSNQAISQASLSASNLVYGRYIRKIVECNRLWLLDYTYDLLNYLIN